MVSLVVTYRKLWNRFSIEKLAGPFVREISESFGKRLDKAILERDKQDPRYFLDVFYPDLMADPVGTVRKIYDYFHYPFSSEFETRMLRWLKENPQGKHGLHDYSLYQKIFTDQMMEEHFGNYRKRFGV